MKQILIKEITDDLNKLMNNFIIDKDNRYLDHEIRAKINNHLGDFYMPNWKINEYLVVSNYPDVKVFVRERKGSDIVTIKIQRFERLEKLLKLNSISILN